MIAAAICHVVCVVCVQTGMLEEQLFDDIVEEAAANTLIPGATVNTSSIVVSVCESSLCLTIDQYALPMRDVTAGLVQLISMTTMILCDLRIVGDGV